MIGQSVRHLALPLAIALLGCGPGASPGEGGAKDMAEQQLAKDLETVRRGRILFTHHSVGRNLLAGVDRIDASAGGGRLRVLTLDDPQDGGPALVHGSGGRNTAPKSKMDHFAEVLRDPARPEPELALLKLCYVDFNPSTDVGDVFAHYQRTIEALRRELPGVVLAHVTVPLRVRPTDVKSRVQRLLGKQVWEDATNVKRDEFNRRLAAAFPSDPIFDLARVESTGPDGSPSTFEAAGRAVPSLHPAYTDDGGHLNAKGQEAGGAAMIRFLADALRSREAARLEAAR